MKKFLKPVVLCFCLLSLDLAMAQSGDSNCRFRGYPSSIVSLVMGEKSPAAVSSTTGIVLSSDGIIMASYQAIKGADSVQIRTQQNGQFDQAVLLAFDEANDLAVLRTNAKIVALAPGSTQTINQGDPVYVFTRRSGEAQAPPAVAVGSVRSVKKTNHVTGARVEYETIQFAAPLTTDAAGSALLDCEGRLLGMVTSRRDEDGFYVATKFSSMLDYVALSSRVFDSGKNLKLPDESASEASVHKSEPTAITKRVRTFYVRSNTGLIPRDHMLQALRNEKDFAQLDMVITDDPLLADVEVDVDYIPFTFDYTFKAYEKKGKVVLAAGRVTEFNGYFAAPALAKKLVNQLKVARTQQAVAAK